MSWYKSYQSFNSMTISELKEILKSKNLPVSGKKMDLIRYLIFEEYPQISLENDRRSGGTLSSFWLKLKYEMWLSPSKGFDAINYQDINSKVA